MSWVECAFIAVALAVLSLLLPETLRSVVMCAVIFGAAFLIARLVSLGTKPIVHAGVRPESAGAYELTERIATGGMGEIWRARHPGLNRPAAIKLIRPQQTPPRSALHTDEIARSFAREARVTAMLRSPHTIRVYDYGETAEGALYYAMELLGGLNLSELVDRFGAQPAERVVHILRGVCLSLIEAHEAGLIHRDIKPGNVQLTVLGGDYDMVKLLDFGLVQELADPDPANAGRMRGTPGYMAPEAIATDLTLDARADLYSLGCVAYRLLTGRPVFDEKSVPHMVRAHVEDAPMPPSFRINGIPVELERLVLDLLQKNRDDRPETAARVLERLDAMALASSWSLDQSGAWWRGNFGDALDATPSGQAPELDLAPRKPKRRTTTWNDVVTVPDASNAFRSITDEARLSIPFPLNRLSVRSR